MTLLCCGKMSENAGVLVAVDSMLGAGYRWNSGPKLLIIQPRVDCALVFEGATSLAYPLALNALNFLSLSDNLADPDVTDPTAVALRVQSEIEGAFQGIASDQFFDPRDDNCSLLFVGWSPRAAIPVLRHMCSPVTRGGAWNVRNLEREVWELDQPFFAGNGDRNPVGEAQAHFQSQTLGSTARKAYDALLHVIDDPTETAVGGTPQIVLAGPSGFTVVGTTDHNNRRTLLGRPVLSGAHGRVTYHPRDLADILR